MKKRIPLIIAGLVLAAGAGTFFYPTACDILSRITTTAAIADYQKQVGNTDESRMDEMIGAAGEYNGRLSGSLSMDPFETGQNEPYREDEEYNRLLKMENNDVMGYIDIPKIDVYLPVYHSTSGEVLKKGAGHLYGSALPVGGEGSHSVISAHRGLPSSRLFTDLDQVEEGDVFYFHVLNRILAYQVDQIEVVEPTGLKDLDPVPEKDYMTLFTCTPYGINSHRMLVRGIRIPYEVVDEKEAAVRAQYGGPRMKATLPDWVRNAVLGVSAVLVCAAIAAIIWWKRKRDRKRNEEKREL